ncbi:helix-turn-helix domain-containing protein [Streptomyces abyssomicinicus]|uniref:helix-turn-helix domain-containing protein n=1 Tax=Streptomyces abyssomicinicus TaxID=574929 RepID=UPI00124FCC6C|nr:helix-turn-helix domain-containing protein [Streptomyces abyssomicinicus]
MLTVRDLPAFPELGITACQVGDDREVHCAQVLSDTDWIRSSIGHALIVTHGRYLEDAERIMYTLSAGGAAALVVSGAAPDTLDPALRETAAQHRLPLLTTSHSLSDWKALLTHRVAELSVVAARRHAARLSTLLDQLAHPQADTVTGIAEYLAAELPGSVVVRDSGGVRAAAPPAAPVTLAAALEQPDQPRQMVDGLYVSSVPLGGQGALVVGTPRPLGQAETELTTCAAKVLSVAMPGRRRSDDLVVSDAVRQVRLSAFQLLMTGHAVDAQRVTASIMPGLLDPTHAQVYVTDCGRAGRALVMAQADRLFAGQALSVACPAFDNHIISVVPLVEEQEHEHTVRHLLDVFRTAGVHIGGSQPHPLKQVGDAYDEALAALTRASHYPERIVIASPRPPGLADVLPAGPARSWASALLQPILSTARIRQLELTAMALEFRTTAASKVLGMHRNTLARRVTQTCEAVGLDPERTMHRIALSLAIQVVRMYGTGSAGEAGPPATLHDLLTGPEVRAWADKTLRPLATDRRDLVRTLRSWVTCEFHVDQAAVRVGIAPKTVRAHIQAAEHLLERDFITGIPQDLMEDHGEHRLSGIRPLTCAMYATTPAGEPYPALTTTATAPRPANGSPWPLEVS